ncbi:MAG: YeeE/YedE thiosulfate transporter family protein [Alphaproteobacteria bacterium]|jgi:hypothetical protein|nr:YeeE/YedE thiosulfate transporter family protein [Alphaproteobacteria bacterium]MDP6515116.1 YeeE/YedE thiosulfate transporter family protein [Alphaproteobacteria bacterium]
MENFTPISALIGGVLIGVSASMLLLLNGRLAGVSSILHGAVPPQAAGDSSWRYLFLGGLIVGALIVRAFEGDQPITFDASPVVILLGGLLVGLGTCIGGGCTSGHGVCGIGRLSVRSMVATVTFMATALITVLVMRHGLGG